MIIFKQEITEDNRNATSVDDFYYRGTEYESGGGTGIRGLSAQYLRDRKIIDRQIVLKNNGCTLEITTIFKDRQSMREFFAEDLHKAAGDFFEDRHRTMKSEMYEIQDELSIRTLAYRRILNSFKNMTHEEILQRIDQLQGQK